MTTAQTRRIQNGLTEMREILMWTAGGFGLLMVAGTLASFTRSTHWAVRLWDFPRVQIGCTAAVCALVFGTLAGERGTLQWFMIAAMLATATFQVWKVRRYSPLARKEVLSTVSNNTESRLRLLISNVLMDNREYHRVIDVIRAADADVVMLLEPDDAWMHAVEDAVADYPNRLIEPRDNFYGLLLYSRLPLEDARIEYLVQDDIPSAHATVVLRDGTRVRFYGLHPRPPEPLNDQDSTARDAELVLVGKRIGAHNDVPTVICGDLNDVATSPSTQLFRRLSGLLDPRIGRGSYNSFNAKYPIIRYPLEHFFHSHHFRLVELKRMPAVGSDHFPMLLEISHEPDATLAQPAPTPEPGDHEEANERLAKENEAAMTGEDRPKGE